MGDSLLQPVTEQQAVGQVCQRVVVRLVHHERLRLPLLGHIEMRGDESAARQRHAANLENCANWVSPSLTYPL